MLYISYFKYKRAVLCSLSELFLRENMKGIFSHLISFIFPHRIRIRSKQTLEILICW